MFPGPQSGGRRIEDTVEVSDDIDLRAVPARPLWK